MGANDTLAHLDPVPEVAELLERAISTEADRRIKPGFHAGLDAVAETVSNAQFTLLGLERRLRERTGIRSLKVGYNKVFGYYIEVTRSNLAHVPADFIRRQTLANCERFVTEELGKCEMAILRAEEQIASLEESVFAEVRDAAGAAIGRLLATAAALAELDVLAAFAQVAAERRYVRPVLDTSGDLVVEGGRHPVVEAALEDGAFIANDCRLGGAVGSGPPCVLLITGPNMAGKSTYLRQVALIVLMAQVGSFVPATSARIGLVDRIFTRVGAHDDLAAGASTFLVEMVETAAILRHATARSLLIFDEIGRGTSTFDGLSIAQAVVEDVHDRVGARTLFATHYHELIALAERLSDLANANAAAVEEGGRVVFLHRIQPGGADRSYGIHVAAVAGLPEHVTERARALLADLEGTRSAEPVTYRAPTATTTAGGMEAVAPASRTAAPADQGERPVDAALHDGQPHGATAPDAPVRPPVSPDSVPSAATRSPSAFTRQTGTAEPRGFAVLAQLRGIDLARTTPLDALNLLATLQERALEAAAPDPPIRLVSEQRAGDPRTAPSDAAPRIPYSAP